MAHRAADEQVDDVVDYIIDRTLGRLPKPTPRQSKTSGSQQMGGVPEQSSQQQQNAGYPFTDWAAI